MKSSLAVIACIMLYLGLPSSSSAQIAWDAPSLMRPGSPSGLSILLFEGYPGDELGAMVTWRNAAAPSGVGFRAGVADDPGGDLAVMVGLDFSGMLATLEGAGDPSVIWWTGAGIGVGEEVLASFPLGLVFGWQGSSDGVVFLPYAGGHAALDIFSGPGDDLDIDGSVDLGVDIGWASGFMARFGASVGGRDSFAIGVRLPT
jgi:hypothetical protein